MHTHGHGIITIKCFDEHVGGGQKRGHMHGETYHDMRIMSVSMGLSGMGRLAASRYSPMSEVCAPRYLAGLVSTHG